jgi:hypothetical protein
VLREQDSNLQPCGYGRFRNFHSGPDYLITLNICCPRNEQQNEGVGRFWGLSASSSSPSLCTFLATVFTLCEASLRIALFRRGRNLGFPEFTRCFNPDYSGKLLFLHEDEAPPHADLTAACSTIELSRKVISPKNRKRHRSCLFTPRYRIIGEMSRLPEQPASLTFPPLEGIFLSEQTADSSSRGVRAV